MTVKDLIEMLKTFPMDSDVVLACQHGTWEYAEEVHWSGDDVVVCGKD
jgi:hypothetical protein